MHYFSSSILMIFLIGVTVGGIYNGLIRIGKREKGFSLRLFLGSMSVLLSFFVWFILFNHYYPEWG